MDVHIPTQKNIKDSTLSNLQVSLNIYICVLYICATYIMCKLVHLTVKANNRSCLKKSSLKMQVKKYSQNTHNVLMSTAILPMYLNTSKSTFAYKYAEYIMSTLKFVLDYMSKIYFGPNPDVKVKSRSHHVVACLHPVTNVPTKDQLPTLRCINLSFYLL